MKIDTDDEVDFAGSICESIYDEYCVAIEARGCFSLVLSGGNTPKLILKELMTNYLDRIEWGKVDFFWTDERCVPQDHHESNYKLALEGLLRFVSPRSVNRIDCVTTEKISQAAENYEVLILDYLKQNCVDRFDVILLGMGLDGHVASVFPGIGLKKSSQGLVGITPVMVNGFYRISLTLELINRTKLKLLMLLGSEKEKVLYLKHKNLPVHSLDNLIIYLCR